MDDKQRETCFALLETFELAKELLFDLPDDPKFQQAWDHVIVAQTFIQMTLHGKSSVAEIHG